jgi:hypothetical protein
VKIQVGGLSDRPFEYDDTSFCAGCGVKISAWPDVQFIVVCKTPKNWPIRRITCTILLSFHTTLQSFEIIYKSVALASLISRRDILNGKVVLLLKKGAVFYLRGRRPGEKGSRRLISYLGA